MELSVLNSNFLGKSHGVDFLSAPSEVVQTLVCSLFSAHLRLKSVLLSPITKAPHTGAEPECGTFMRS